MIPNFLCVGFKKSGTTTLQDILITHPQIFLPSIKETRFFSINSELKRGIKYYENKYYPIKEGRYKAIGGIEPTWMNSAYEIQKYFPKDTKFIFIMRNPVDFCYSLWKMGIRRGNIRYSWKMPFNNPLIAFKMDVKEELARKRNLLRGYFKLREAKYIHFINNFLKYYPKENMKFIIFEEFINNKKKYIDEICDFIGVGRLLSIRESTHSNIGNKISKNKITNWIIFFVRHLIDENSFYLRKNGPDYSEFYKFLVDNFSTNTNQKLDLETRIILEKYYAKSIKQLEKFLNKDLSELWYDSNKYILKNYDHKLNR